MSVWFIIALVLSYILTASIRRFALQRDIIDIPNERSSHTVPTPRGGGLAIVAAFLLSVVIIAALGLLSADMARALIGGGLIIALVGWMDDRQGLSPRLRSVFHFLAAAWALYCLDGFTFLNVGFADLYLGWAGTIIAAIGMVWMINLYNFMDGIDGIAGGEAICAALAAGALLSLNGSKGLAYISIALAFSAAGFLIWNWPPAKIFMGDVGSGFLGFVFAVLAIASEKSGGVPLIIWMMLLGVFVIDATVTLVRRLFNGEKLSEAHRSHVYQLAVQSGYSHRQVTSMVLLINIGLAGLALAAWHWHEWMLEISLGAALVLIIMHIVLYRHFSAVLLTRQQQLGPEISVYESLSQAAVSSDD